jgi:tight adherence protein C
VTGMVLLTAVGTGLGLWLIVVGLWPRPPRLDKVLAALDPPEPVAAAADEPDGWVARIGRPGVRYLRRIDLPTESTRRELAAVGTPVSRHLAEQAGATVVGLLLAPVFAIVLTAAGVNIGMTVPAAATLLLGALGFLAPELAVRAEAAKHRAAVRHALGSFLNLTVTALAGGAGVDQALDDAASVGRGPAYAELRYALAEARTGGTPAWDTLAKLGRRVGVEELSQLAATVGLAGAEGAKVRASLRSRAEALRTKQLTDAEASAAAATERMALPIVALMAGFLVFLGFPAVAAVLSGL